jgi:hypothetical protein
VSYLGFSSRVTLGVGAGILSVGAAIRGVGAVILRGVTPSCHPEERSDEGSTSTSKEAF